MKKTTIKFLCTTILISGVALGMDDKEKSKTSGSQIPTPHTPVSKIKEKLTKIPKTPTVEVQEKKYLADNSPYTANFLAKRDITKIKSEHATQRTSLLQQMAQAEYEEKIEKAKAAEAQRFQTLLRKQEEEKRLEEERKEREKRAEEKKNEEIENLRQRSVSIQEELENKQSEILSMEKTLAEAKSAAEKQRAQKLDIMEKADETQTDLTQKLEDAEEKLKELIVENYQTKVILQTLILEKETDQRLKGVPNSEIKIEQQSMITPKPKDVIVVNTSGTPQSQGSSSLGSNEVLQSTDHKEEDKSAGTTTKKREVKKKSESNF